MENLRGIWSSIWSSQDSILYSVSRFDTLHESRSSLIIRIIYIICRKSTIPSDITSSSTMRPATKTEARRAQRGKKSQLRRNSCEESYGGENWRRGRIFLGYQCQKEDPPHPLITYYILNYFHFDISFFFKSLLMYLLCLNMLYLQGKRW